MLCHGRVVVVVVVGLQSWSSAWLWLRSCDSVFMLFRGLVVIVCRVVIVVVVLLSCGCSLFVVLDCDVGRIVGESVHVDKS